MLDIEQKNFFLNIVSDFINQKKTTPPGEYIDWEALMHLAKNHEMSGIIFHQCKEFIPKNIIDAYERTYSATLFSAANRADMQNKIEEAFAKNNIESFTVKGAAVAKYYPLPSLRTMGDTDIVVRAEDRDKAHNVLLGLGLNCTRKYINSDWGYEKNGIEFELHDRLVYGEISARDDHIDFFNDCFKYIDGVGLDPSFHFLFLLVHLRKHISNSGVGFRQFVDIALMCKKEDGLNWEWISEKLDELELTEFCKNVFALIKIWFKVSSPINIEEIDDSFLGEMTDYVFKNGIFGFQNEENASALEIGRKIKEDRQKLTLTKKLFPPYEEMILNPAYKSLDGKKALLPAFWIYRLLRGAFGEHRKTNMHMLTSPAVSDEEVAKKIEFLKRLGIN